MNGQKMRRHVQIQVRIGAGVGDEGAVCFHIDGD
jgi:hypothetical protein